MRNTVYVLLVSIPIVVGLTTAGARHRDKQRPVRQHEEILYIALGLIGSTSAFVALPAWSWFDQSWSSRLSPSLVGILGTLAAAALASWGIVFGVEQSRDETSRLDTARRKKELVNWINDAEFGLARFSIALSQLEFAALCLGVSASHPVRQIVELVDGGDIPPLFPRFNTDTTWLSTAEFLVAGVKDLADTDEYRQFKVAHEQLIKLSDTTGLVKDFDVVEATARHYRLLIRLASADEGNQLLYWYSVTTGDALRRLRKGGLQGSGWSERERRNLTAWTEGFVPKGTERDQNKTAALKFKDVGRATLANHHRVELLRSPRALMVSRVLLQTLREEVEKGTCESQLDARSQLRGLEPAQIVFMHPLDHLREEGPKLFESISEHNSQSSSKIVRGLARETYEELRRAAAKDEKLRSLRIANHQTDTTLAIAYLSVVRNAGSASSEHPSTVS